MPDFYFILFLKRLDADEKLQYFLPYIPCRMVSGNEIKLCLKYFCLPIYFVHFEISLTFISPKPSPKPSDVQLLSTRQWLKFTCYKSFKIPNSTLWSIIYYQHVETFLDSHSRDKCVYKWKCVSTIVKGKTTHGLQGD